MLSFLLLKIVGGRSDWRKIRRDLNAVAVQDEVFSRASELRCFLGANSRDDEMGPIVGGFRNDEILLDDIGGTEIESEL